MVVMIKENGKTMHGICEFIVDKEEDVKNLPKFPDVAFGSSVMIKGGKVLILYGDSNEYE